MSVDALFGQKSWKCSFEKWKKWLKNLHQNLHQRFYILKIKSRKKEIIHYVFKMSFYFSKNHQADDLTISSKTFFNKFFEFLLLKSDHKKHFALRKWNSLVIRNSNSVKQVDLDCLPHSFVISAQKLIHFYSLSLFVCFLFWSLNM